MERSGMRDVTESCRISIDKDGKWFYQGREIVNPLVLEYFCNALEKDEHGRYRIVLEQEMCYLEVEDTPFVVASVRGEPETGLAVLLNTGSLHDLDPATLCIGDGNVMYCTVLNDMKVRFSRAAYYILALMMEEDERGDIVLRTGNKVHRISPGGADSD
ncbi:MAG TPA: DUF1285 domain-containing protein [Deltaproteobacteria bacterium]|nr:DUF1285 domain-containing protein [Deltaproteobacteria bacterium]HOI08664.1 DUF1285 domain-containing protein [Deltaproteobacteria bacterium]